ncbi:type II secretion system GspH family protein [Candidatus Pacebacteria bacterium]|nr:type II secretion system GspH family protein [Candidatus Paceibacterota bacterium]
MKKNIFKRGFTLIELLVVIAIIGILAAVVLASLNTARDKGSDAAIKSNLNNMRAQAELYYDDNSRTYGTEVSACTGGMFTDSSQISQALAGIASTKVCDTSDNTAATAAGTSWMMAAELSDGTYFCVDSNGSATNTASAPSAIAEATATPADCDN